MVHPRAFQADLTKILMTTEVSQAMAEAARKQGVDRVGDRDSSKMPSICIFNELNLIRFLAF